MAERGKYRTRQRELVLGCLRTNSERYLTVDEVWACVTRQGERVGRSTVYRNLEAMTQDATAIKVVAPGGEARYRLCSADAAGQLVCVACHRALPLDCHMVGDFSHHVREHHGFKIIPARTVLYGLCEDCMEAHDEA